MHVVLVEPQIPQNTGNIVRLCAATGAALHLVGKLGFRIDDRSLKRAGLDYWKFVDITCYDSFEDFENRRSGGGAFYLLTTKGKKIYSEAAFKDDDFLVFGSETGGLSRTIRERYSKSCLKIPMADNIRSINLATSAGIVLYEALRQTGFPGLD